MAASDWMPCRIHPTHPKILAIAQMTGDSPAEACGKAIAWFWHCDQNYAQPETYLDLIAFHNVVLSPRKRRNKASYYEAFSSKEVGWVTLSKSGTILICDYEDNFSKSSKRRAQGRLRAARHRSRQAEQAKERDVERDKSNADSVTPSVTHRVTSGAPTARGRERSNTSKQVPERAQPLAQASEASGSVSVAAGFALGQGLPTDILDLFGELEIALNRRTEAVASMALKAWGPEKAATKLAQIGQRCLDTGKQQGVMIAEMELTAHKHLRQAEANAARRAAMASNPVVGLTPEATLRGQQQALCDLGWQEVRRVIRAMDLHRRPRLRNNAVFQLKVLRACETSRPTLNLVQGGV